MNWHDYFRYEDGKLYWIGFPNPEQTRSVKVGDVAGYKHPDNKGYVRVQVMGKMLRVHRVIWEMHNGKIPESMEIDHINGIRSDNRIENLRIVDGLENMKNKGIYKNNKTGFVGVEKIKANGKYRASIRVNKKLIFLGEYISIEDAIDARKKAECQYLFHKNHGVRNAYTKS